MAKEIVKMFTVERDFVSKQFTTVSVKVSEEITDDEILKDLAFHESDKIPESEWTECNISYKNWQCRERKNP